MRMCDRGSFIDVQISRTDIGLLAVKWPCNHLGDKPLNVSFDKRNWDLVDSDDQETHPGADPQAILALIEDAKEYAKRKLERKKR